MSLPHQIAKHFREVFFGGNWTCVNFKETLNNIMWQQAIEKKEGFHTIAALTYHIGYFVSAVLPVFQGKSLDAHDKFSFDHPTIQSQEDWEQLIQKILADATTVAQLIKELPEERLWEDFTDAKYGNYYRNIHGIIEHCHYHLGQIVMLKKTL